MFNFIFFNVFEIFVVAAAISVVGVLFFALRHRLREDAKERSDTVNNRVIKDQMAVRDAGMVSSGTLQTHKTDQTRED